MNKKDIVSFLRSEVEKKKQKLSELAETKVSADGPRTSWHSTIHLDIERDIEVYKQYRDRCLDVLSAIEGRQPQSTRRVCKGSIALLEIEGEAETFIVVDEGGAAIGSCQIISSQSPIGKAIWDKEISEEVKVNTPQGPISVKVLELMN